MKDRSGKKCFWFVVGRASCGVLGASMVLWTYRTALALKGASIIQVEGDKVVSDQAYFDRVAVAEQLQPKELVPAARSLASSFLD